MSNFNAEEYKKKLEASTSCETCEKVPVSKLKKNSHYIFISYSHKDYKKVYSDLADLYESDIPFWYDEGLPAGKNWDDVVREKMTDSRCAGIIFYLSENLFLSRSIQTEICIALGEENDSTVPGIKKDYFCVNTTELAPSKILKEVYLEKEFPDVEDEMEAQFKWVQMLNKAFPDKATYLLFSNPHHKTDLVKQIGINFHINPNYNPYDFGDAIFLTGKGVIEFSSGAIYDGDFKNGEFEGYGVLYYFKEHYYADLNFDLKKFLTSPFKGNSDVETKDIKLGPIYRGYWKKGKRHGEGKMIWSDGAAYEGDWVDDKRHGKGKMTLPDGGVYEGDWKDGKLHGKGKTTNSDGTIYEGERLDGKRHGKGKLTLPDGGVYEGYWKDGKRHGEGKMIWSDGAAYEGDWKDNKRHGKGKMIWSDGAAYEGDWVNDKCHGKGKLTFPDGDIQEGDWEDNKARGQCVFIRKSDGHRYVGGWRDNGSTGYGTYIYPDGASRAGNWDGDILLEGEGVIRYDDGSYYDGQIQNNKRHGKGKMTYSDGTVQEGYFENDIFVGAEQ